MSKKPRTTPDRDSKYMGLAWMYASFSKDPSTQVGAQIVGPNNMPLGSGYNGPPRRMIDTEVIWDRPTKANPDAISKYDLIVHAEINAIDHCWGLDLEKSTLYVTALPCSKCMLEIVKKGIERVVYYDFKSHANSILQNPAWVEKTFDIARRGNTKVEKFEGSVAWLEDWVANLKHLGIFEM
jgi:deoxycytidylate deaminase